MATNIRRGLEELRELMTRAGYAAAAPAALAAALSQAPAVGVPAGLAAFIKTLVASGAAQGAAGAGAAAAGGISLGWKLATGLSLAVVLGAGSYGLLHRPAPPVLPAAAPATAEVPADAEKELAEALARPASINLRGEPAASWLNETCDRHNLDCAWPQGLWGVDAALTVSHQGTLRECLEKLAGAAKVRVSFEAGLVRFWRPADPERIKALAERLASNDVQERCVAVWRLGCLTDPDAIALILKPALDDPSPAVRHWAARALAQQCAGGAAMLLPLEPAGVDRADWVRRAMASDRRDLRRLAICAAGVWRLTPDEGRPLIALLENDDPSDDSSTLAAWVLGRSRTASARDALVAKAGSSVRRGATGLTVGAIARLGLGDFPDRMMRQVEDGPSNTARLNAINALGQLRWAPATEVIARAGKEKSLSWAADAALKRIGQTKLIGVPDAARDAAGQDMGPAWVGVCRLQTADTPEARDALLRLVGGPDGQDPGRAARAEVRSQALIAIVRAGDRRANEAVFRLAAAGQDRESAGALRLLPQLTGDGVRDRAFDVLVAALKTPTREQFQSTRAAAADALAALGDERAVPALAEACRDNEWFVRMAAATDLGKLGTAKAVDELFKLLAEDKPGDKRSLRTVAYSGIKTVMDREGVLDRAIAIDGPKSWLFNGNFLYSKPYSPELADRLLALLAKDDPDLQALAVNGLGQWGLKGPEGVPGALRLLGTAQKVEQRRAAVMSLGSLGARAEDVDPRVGAAVVERLAVEAEWSIRNQLCSLLSALPKEPGAAKAILAQAGADKEYMVRTSALKALGALRSPETFEPLLAMLDEKPKVERPGLPAVSIAPDVLKALGQIGDRKAVEPALKQLAAGDSQTRAAAAECLGKLGDKRAVEPLLKLLEDEKRPAAEITLAADALGRLGDERAVPALVRILERGDRHVVFSASMALNREPFVSRPEVIKALAAYEVRRDKDPGLKPPDPQPRPQPEPGPGPMPTPPEVF